MQISVVAPAFNEEEGIAPFLSQLRNVLDSINHDYEVIIVNDGSTDKTLLKLLEIDWSNLIIVDLVTNSGHMPALEAGLRVTRGELVITMDADQQHPAEHIPLMIKKQIDTKCDVVVGVRIRGSENGWFREKASIGFYRLLGRISKVKIEENVADFRIITRSALDELLKSPETTKIFRFLISDYGYRIEKLSFTANERIFGQSKYRISTLLKLATQSLIGFSTAPLTAISIGGVFFLLLGFIYAIFLLLSYASGASTPGWTSIMLFLTIFSSLQFLAIGILGRYMVEILKDIRQRPSYIVRQIYSQKE